MKIVRPQQAELKAAWPREDQDFTPWLADNLEFLEDVGLGDLELVQAEVPIPGASRRLDILATTADDRLVAIENQYRSLDHDHLTRGLAYAVGLDAKALLIIAEGYAEEFIAVADYLNRCAEAGGDDGVAVFLVVVALEVLGDQYIPRFEVVARPNAWRASIHKDAQNQPYSDASQRRRAAQRQFWGEFLVLGREAGLDLWSNTESREGGYLTAQAVPGVNITWNLVLRVDDCYPMLWLDVGDTAKNSRILFELRDRVAPSGRDAGLEWTSKEDVRSCSVNGEPIADCGWKTDPDRRTPLLPTVLDRFSAFRATLEPHVQAVYEEVCTENG